jgi:DNA-binding LacI/PurR family transcriptional regulator
MVATLKDVASLAGVSLATASRALNDSDVKTNVQTQKLVRKAAKQLNYIPNSAARSLVAGSANIVGVVYGPTSSEIAGNDFGIKVLLGIQQKLNKKSFTSTIVSGETWTDVYHNVANLIKTQNIRHFVLLYTMPNDPVRQLLDEEKIKYVMIGEPEDFNETLYVDNDNRLSGYQGASILIDKLSVRKPLFISTKQMWKFELNRFNGFTARMDEAGIIYDKFLVSEETENIIKEVNEFLKTSDFDFDGIMTTDDRIGLIVSKALRENGIKNVPIVSFNNSEYAKIADKNFYSFDTTPELLGEAAIELLNSHQKGHLVIQAIKPEVRD